MSANGHIESWIDPAAYCLVYLLFVDYARRDGPQLSRYLSLQIRVVFCLDAYYDYSLASVSHRAYVLG